MSWNYDGYFLFCGMVQHLLCKVISWCPNYHEFMNNEDKKTLEDVIYFNQFDLYSKEDDTNISDEVKEYYNQILDEFFINDLQWKIKKLKFNFIYNYCIIIKLV